MQIQNRIDGVEEAKDRGLNKTRNLDFGFNLSMILSFRGWRRGNDPSIRAKWHYGFTKDREFSKTQNLILEGTTEPHLPKLKIRF
jgi:hypothetical protein